MSRPKGERPQLAAEISVFTPADALQWANSSGLTGRLAFRSPYSRIELLFDDGGLVHASSSRRLAAFGRHLFSEGLIDEVDQAAAMVYSRDYQSRIGSAMVELGVLDAAVVRRQLHEHNLNLAVIPVTWTKGWVNAEVKPAEVLLDLAPEPIDPTLVLMEAARRVDETKRIRRKLPHDGIVTALGDGKLPKRTSARWERTLSTHQEGSSLAQHYERVGGSRYRFLETVNELVEASVLLVAGSQADSEPSDGDAILEIV